MSDMARKGQASRKATARQPRMATGKPEPRVSSGKPKVRATTGAERLLPALPSVTFVEEPLAIDRFELRLSPDGSLYLKSTRERIDEFVRRCAEVGLDVQIHYISLCG